MSAPSIEPLGFRAVAQYQRLQAAAPHLEPVALPTGFTISSYTENPDLAGLVAGLRCFEDMWGITASPQRKLKRD